MKEAKNLIDDTFEKKVKFIVFSNESHSFKNSESILVSNNTWYLDHHLMSLCQYLIGPPSSFTLWASYLGKIPLYHIKDKKEKILLERLYLVTYNFIWLIYLLILKSLSYYAHEFERFFCLFSP